jgi:hypothetical protein
LYHIAPVYRAAVRLLMMYGHWDAGGGDAAAWDEETLKGWWRGKEMGGPWVHLVVHAVCCAGLVWYALAGMDLRPRWRQRRNTAGERVKD